MTELSHKNAVADAADSLSDTKRVPESKPSRRKAERRTHARHAFSATAEAVEHRTGTHLSGRCADVSLGGCYVDAMNPFPTGSEVTLRLKHGAKTFESPSTVIFSKVGMGMGLSFHDTTQDQLSTLAKWTAWLADGLLPLEQEGEINQEVASFALNERQILDQLIRMLIHKHVLTEKEGSTLLSGIFR
jgi:hypothetical protein